MTYVHVAILFGVHTDHGHVIDKESNLIVWVVGHAQFAHFDFDPFHTCGS